MTLPWEPRSAESDVKLVRYPAADLPANIFHLKTSVVGRGAILPIARGRIFSAQQAGGRKCRRRNAVPDSAGNAGGLGAGE